VKERERERERARALLLKEDFLISLKDPCPHALNYLPKLVIRASLYTYIHYII
jgi:hypothetical protein